MSQFSCPTHGQQYMKPSQFPDTIEYCTAQMEGFNPKTGKQNRCNFKVKRQGQPAQHAPATPAAPQPQGSNPRLVAAAAALQAAATRYSGMVATFKAEDVIREASVYYHGWLKLVAAGDPPTPEVLGAATPVADDDIPF